MGVAWAILGGLAGYWSFGHTAFIGIGAFAAGLAEPLLETRSPLLRLAFGLVVGAGACAIFSAPLAYPVLRLRAPTSPSPCSASAMSARAQQQHRRAARLDGVILANAAPPGWDNHVFYFELFLAAAAATLAIAWAIKRSRFGYGLLAIREDEDTARMLGVPTERYKVAAFVLSAVLTGIFGVIYAHSLGYITTGSVYRDDNSLNLMLYSLLGGIGTLLGPILGATLLVVLTNVVLATSSTSHVRDGVAARPHRLRRAERHRRAGAPLLRRARDMSAGPILEIVGVTSASAASSPSTTSRSPCRKARSAA